MKYLFIAFIGLLVPMVGNSQTYIQSLGNCSEYWVARSAYGALRNRSFNQEELIELEKLARSTDHQSSQLASLVLVSHSLRSGLELSALPDYLKENLMVALRDDDINPRNKLSLPCNAWGATSYLVKNECSPDLLNRLYREVTGSDRQAARLASRVLVEWHDTSKIADDRLNTCIVSDFYELHSPNFFRAWKQLDSLGKDNLQHIVSTASDFSEFQSAVLQVLCAKHDITWSPDLEILDQWKKLSSIEKQEHFHRNRVRQAALYLNPTDYCRRDPSSLPRRVRQLLITEGHLRDASDSEKFEWICSWFPIFPK